MADDPVAKRLNTLGAGDEQRVKASSGDNRAGFNTIFFEKTGGTGDFFLEASPNIKSDPDNVIWFDVDGTDSRLIDTSGVVSWQQRAEAFQVKTDGTLTGNWWVF